MTNNKDATGTCPTAATGRLLIAPSGDPAHPGYHLTLGGLLTGLHAHDHLRAAGPLVISSAPGKISSLHAVAATDAEFEQVIDALAESRAFVLIGKSFADSPQPGETAIDRELTHLFAAQVMGIKTGVLGADLHALDSIAQRKVTHDILSRVDLLTVRDQHSALALMRAGIAASATVTADLAFALPSRLDDRARTARLGIVVPPCGLPLDDSRLRQLGEAIDRLTTRFSVTPVVVTWDGHTQTAARPVILPSLEAREHVNLTSLASVDALLDAFSSFDLMLSSDYHLVLGAALCGVPSIALGDDSSLVALARQLRLGNFALSADSITAPMALDAAQRVLGGLERIRPALAEAVCARAVRARENLDLLSHMVETPPASRQSACSTFDGCAELQPLVEKLKKHTQRAGGPPRPISDAEGRLAERRVTASAPLSAEPLVTIYICAYNAGKWIEQALASALGQTYRNLEVLVVDDGSTDDTVARVRKFNDTRVALHQIPHGGLAKVRTYAKEHFHGELVVNLDADDWIAPELIAKQVALLQAHPEVDVTYCDYVLVDAAGKPTGVEWNYADFPDPNRLVAEMFQAGCSRVPNGSMMERADVARRVGGYDPILKTAVDFEYLAKLAGIARAFRGVHESLYFYRDFGGGHSGNYAARNFTVTTVLRRLWDQYGGELLLGADIGRELSDNRKTAVYLCRAGDVVSRHGETYISRGAPERFFALAAEFYHEAFARDPSNVAAYTRMMHLAALGFGQNRAPNDQGRKRRTSRADTLYANQPELDVLFEEVFPTLLAEGQPPIRITVLDNMPPCDAYTIAIEAVRHGLSPEQIQIRALTPKSENQSDSTPPVFPHTAVFNDGLNHLVSQIAERAFTKHPDGTYQPDGRVARLVSVTDGELTAAPSTEITGESDVVVAQTIWNSLEGEAAAHLLAKLVESTRPNGFLLLGGHDAVRNAALAERSDLEPVMTRFDDVHDGWRYRRTVYGRRPDGLGPIDRRWPDWPRRYGAIFRRRQAQEFTPAGNPDLKTYWMERGKVYKNQYPAKPIATQPVPYRLVQALQAEQPSSVLDYGCGFGKILREVRRVLPDARLVGLDISGNVLADGRQYLLGGPPVGLVESDGKAIPLLGDSFDVTFTHVTLIHVPHEEIRGVLQELVRVTKKTLYIGETADTAHESFYYFAHDYPTLFAEMGLDAKELDVLNKENQPGARLFRVDVTAMKNKAAAEGTLTPEAICRPGTSRRLRLLVVSDRRTVHTRRFCRYFRKQGHEVHLYDSKPNWEGFEGIVQHWVDPVQYPERDMQVQFYARVARLRDVVRTFQPDWVHGHFLIGWGWWAALASAGVPLALTAWGSDVFLLPREDPQVQNFTRWSIRLADLLTADSRALAKATEELVDGNKRVMLVPFGIDTDLFHPQVDGAELRRRLMIPAQARVVLSPRQIKPGANIEIIIEALARVRRRVPDALLLLKTYLTTFDQQSEYMALIRKKISDLDLWDGVRIIHDLPDSQMPALYALAEVTVSIRDTDGTPCTLFESSAAGTPVIAGNIPSLAEWIRDGENGFLVGIKDADATAEALVRVLAGGPDIERIAAAARNFAIAEGDYHRCFAHIENAYAQFTGAPARATATLQNMMGRRAKRLDILNAARADLCDAIDRGDHEHGLRLFNTLPRLLSEKNFDEVGSLVPDRIAQPVARREDVKPAARHGAVQGRYETVGILIITQNHLPALKRNLPRLFANTHIPFALTIVDNGSTDGTVAWLQDFASTIPVAHEFVFHKTDTGMLAPTEQYFKRTGCRILVRVTPDMDFPPGWLMELYDRYADLAEPGQKFWLSRNAETVHRSLKLKSGSHLENRREYARFYEEQGQDITVTRYGQERMFTPEGNPRLTYVADCAEGSCLDIGCQYGAYAIWLARQGHDVWAIDLGRSYLREARRRLAAEPVEVRQRVRLLQSWAERLPFADAEFQTVLLSEILEHVIDPETVVAEALRVLHPGGMLYLSVPGYSDETLEHVRQFDQQSILSLLRHFGEQVDPATIKWYYKRRNDHFMLALRKSPAAVHAASST